MPDNQLCQVHRFVNKLWHRRAQRLIYLSQVTRSSHESVSNVRCLHRWRMAIGDCSVDSKFSTGFSRSPHANQYQSQQNMKQPHFALSTSAGLFLGRVASVATLLASRIYIHILHLSKWKEYSNSFIHDTCKNHRTKSVQRTAHCMNGAIIKFTWNRWDRAMNAMNVRWPYGLNGVVCTNTHANSQSIPGGNRWNNISATAPMKTRKKNRHQNE